MLEALILALALPLAGAPADLPPVPAVAPPAPVQCADAALGSAVLPAALLMADVGAAGTCQVSETCDEHPDISCSGTTCSAVSRDCSVNQRGYVECDGNRTWCPSCPECVDGDSRIVNTGECCPPCDGSGYKEYQECVNGQWETQSIFCGPVPSCPICP